MSYEHRDPMNCPERTTHWPRLLTSSLLLCGLFASAAGVSAADAPPVSETPPLFTEDFESTEVGAIPAGFTAAGKVAVADDFAFSGKKSLRVEAAPRDRGGSRFRATFSPSSAASSGAGSITACRRPIRCPIRPAATR